MSFVLFLFSEILSFAYYISKPSLKCLKLCQDYFEKYYVGENSVFPPKIWAGLMGKNEIRYTNNGSEAFHSALGRRFCGITNQPNVFSVLEVLCDFQTINILKLQSDKALKKTSLMTFHMNYTICSQAIFLFKYF